MSRGEILNDQSKLRPGKCSENSRNAGAAGFSENWRNKRRKANSHMSLYLMQHNFDVSKRWTARRLKSFSWKHLDSQLNSQCKGAKQRQRVFLQQVNTLGLGEMDWLHLFNSHDPMLFHIWRQRMLRSNTQSCTPNGGRTLQFFMLMVYIQLGSCGELQDKLGRKSCSLLYEPFGLPSSFFGRVCPWFNSGLVLCFFTGRELLAGYPQIYFAGAYLHSTRPSSSWEVGLTCRNCSFEPYANLVQ